VLDLAYQEIATEKVKKPCPYCKSKKVLKRGKRRKKSRCINVNPVLNGTVKQLELHFGTSN
jgi:hypothetical protein